MSQPRRGLRARPGWRLALAGGLLVAAGCAGTPGGAPAPGPSGGGVRAEQLYVVDCLLPAQIRKLGRAMTYLGPRRAVKTSAQDCEIRGGEYVAYDRADYATALRVWLPLAQEGDRVAQTYVGEIFEKGLGVPPDYATALAWYRRAADQGHARAQINLGHLYEKGLGVPRDPDTALAWYRKAAGVADAIALDAGGLAEASGAATRLELQRLREQVDRSAREAEALRAQLARARDDVEAGRRELDRRAADAAATGQQVDGLRHELERARKEALAARHDPRLPALEAQLAQARREADDARRELDRRAADAAQGRQRADALARDLERAQKEALAARHDPRLPALEAQLAQARREADDARRELDRRAADAAQGRQRADALARDLERAQKEALAGQNDPRLRALEAQLAQRETELGRQREEATRLRERVAALETQATRDRDRLARLAEERVALAGPSIEVIEPSLGATRGVAIVKVPVEAPARERVIVGKVTAPAGLLVLTVNDREEAVDDAGLFRTRVPLRGGQVPINIVAVDRQGKRSTLEFRLAPDEASARRRVPTGVQVGEYHALVIGNRTYAHWPSLRTSEADARQTADLLQRKYGFRTRVLLDARRVDILQALNELRNQLTEKDNLLVYYAGHGYLDEKINRAYWIPVDGALDSNTEWISTVAITDMVSAISAKHVLLVVDSCYSGALTRSALARLEAGMSEEARRHWLEVVAAKRSRTVLSSGDLKPVLDSGGGRHSVFAKAWLDVLARNEDVLEGQRLHREIAARVAFAADALRFEQVPQYAPIRYAGHESGDFLFVPRDQ